MTEALKAVNEAINDPTKGEELKRSSFLDALNGIKRGIMNYDRDAILPLLNDEIMERTKKFEDLTPADEQKLVQLTQDQKRLVAENDRK